MVLYVTITSRVTFLGKRLGFTAETENFHSVSLGQGQEIVAEQALEVAAQKGHWVILQNVHLVGKYVHHMAVFRLSSFVCFVLLFSTTSLFARVKLKKNK